MIEWRNTCRRTVLKGIGAGLAGSALLSGKAVAGESNPGNDHSYTWANDTLYEMLESEPGHYGNGLAGPGQDSEGNHNAHRPLWVIESMAGTGVPGSEHSPHPAPITGIDHVVPVGPGGVFTAQWHVHLVLDEPFDPSLGFGNLANLTNTDGDGNFLTSADAIQSGSDIFVVPLFHPDTGEPDVFTCPVRPHQHE